MGGKYGRIELIYTVVVLVFVLYMSFEGGGHSPLQHAAKIVVMVAAGVRVGETAYGRTDM